MSVEVTVRGRDEAHLDVQDRVADFVVLRESSRRSVIVHKCRKGSETDDPFVLVPPDQDGSVAFALDVFRRVEVQRLFSGDDLYLDVLVLPSTPCSDSPLASDRGRRRKAHGGQLGRDQRQLDAGDAPGRSEQDVQRALRDGVEAFVAFRLLSCGLVRGF